MGDEVRPHKASLMGFLCVGFKFTKGPELKLDLVFAAIGQHD
jgi:hypothetical protein